METSIVTSKEGTISLQTTTLFKTLPAHPSILPISTVRELLEGLTRKRESGVLEKLLSLSRETAPLFSPKQIAFLAPNLGLGLSQATPEEIVYFSCQPLEERGNAVKGKVAVFSPGIFFLILDNDNNSQHPASPVPAKQTSPREQITLHFADEKTVLPLTEAESIVHLPPRTPWIAINFNRIPSTMDSGTRHSTVPEPEGVTQKSNQATADDPPIQQLEKQVERLQQRVDEQEQEIRRLQDPKP